MRLRRSVRCTGHFERSWWSDEGSSSPVRMMVLVATLWITERTDQCLLPEYGAHKFPLSFSPCVCVCVLPSPLDIPAWSLWPAYFNRSHLVVFQFTQWNKQFIISRTQRYMILTFIGPCIIAIVEEWKTNLMSLVILFHILCAQHVSDINISILRSLRLCWWITTSVVLFSVRCVLEILLRLIFGGVRFAGCFNLQNEHHQISAAAKTPTHNELRTRRPML